MAVMQISVTLENVPGALARLVDIFDKEDVSTKAIAAASLEKDSIVRLIVNDPQKAISVLESFHFNYQVDPVLAVEVPCHPAGMNAIVKPLKDADVNIHYIYTTIERLGKETILIIGVDKLDDASEILKQHWITFVGDKVYTL
ncbi:MAG: hypothetical protein PHG91_10310 [Syntrophales bacterium]|nr:hypothetical protein [Syntrophales bacterium]MDD5233774.1 hypothetical protein [Syntrophales bacterium]MDD5532653.1 hypothetical protein [Syntrophales bacterium]